MTRKLLAIAIVLFMAGVCQAGSWLEDTLTNTGKRLGERGINDAGSGAYKGAKDTVTGTGKKTEGNPQNRPSSSGGGEDPTARRRRSGRPASRPAPGRRVGLRRRCLRPSGDVSIEQAESIQSKYDFIPGDKTIFSDDFSDTDIGEFPRKWTLDGPKEGGNNSVEVVEFQGKAVSPEPAGPEGAAPGRVDAVCPPRPEGRPAGEVHRSSSTPSSRESATAPTTIISTFCTCSTTTRRSPAAAKQPSAPCALPASGASR